MNQRTRDLWVIPIITGIVLGAIFMFLGLWLAGTPINPSFSLGWLKLAFFASLPVWITLIVLLLTVILAGLFLRQRARTAEETERKKHLEDQIAKLNHEHEAEIENLNSKEPTLHASWRGDSVWGWATAHPEEDPVYMVRGDVTFLMDNIAEPVILTGVEIDGAQSTGNFDNFQLNPNQPVIRGMRVYFRGKAPKGTEDYTVQLVFKDLRGNRYPTVDHRFKPLPIPERVSIQLGHHVS